MKSRVEQFEAIRKDRAREGLSIRELARRHGVHRRAVRQALDSAVPPPKSSPASRPHPAIGPYRDLIEGWLIADKDAPPKQRHTARRVFQRLIDEEGADLAESTVRAYVAKTKRRLGLNTPEGYCPQVHLPGKGAEVDWGEADVVIDGSPVRVNLFLMRSSFSGAAFCWASLNQTQQAFLFAHTLAFEYFGGVFPEIRYDNLTSAVKKVLKGRRRVEADRFTALRSHYLYEASFTTPGIKGAHEKGGIEGEVGRFRRRHLVPVPEVDSIDQLNLLIQEAVKLDLSRVIDGKRSTVAEDFAGEKGLLLDLPEDPFDTAEQSRVRVDAKSLITVRQNRYSVPVSLVGLSVTYRLGAERLNVYHRGKNVAEHARLFGRFETKASLDHYLELLRSKPGALEGSLALHQERQAKAFPGCFEELWDEVASRQGRSEAARQMVEVLILARDHNPADVAEAARKALASGAIEGKAIEVMLRSSPRAGDLDQITDLDQRLALHDRPLPELGRYDELIGAGR